MSDEYAHLCMEEDMHPMNCGNADEPPRPQDCIHCRGDRTDKHDPDKCMLYHYMDPDFEDDEEDTAVPRNTLPTESKDE